MGDGAEGLVDAQARIEDRLAELEQARILSRRVVKDPDSSNSACSRSASPAPISSARPTTAPAPAAASNSSAPSPNSTAASPP